MLTNSTVFYIQNTSYSDSESDVDSDSNDGSRSDSRDGNHSDSHDDSRSVGSYSDCNVDPCRKCHYCDVLVRDLGSSR